MIVPSLRSAPPPPAMAVEQWVVADFPELRSMRVSLRQAVELQSPASGRELDDVVERMTIVATELATNALLHGRSQATVQLSRSATTFILDVADELPSVPPKIGESRSLEAGGRGLQMAQELALDLGWYAADGRKHVWAQFEKPRRVRRFQAPRISVFDVHTLVRLLRRLGS